MLKQACKKLKQYLEEESDNEDSLEVDSVEDAHLLIIQDPANELILFNFSLPVRWIGFSIEDARHIAQVILDKADLMEKSYEEKILEQSTFN